MASLAERVVETAGASSDIRLPLNSKRLTVSHLRQIGEALGLPTAASLDELRGMIEGLLVEQGKEPMNVQVWLQEDTGITLYDEGGSFLAIKPPVSAPDHTSPESSSAENSG